MRIRPGLTEYIAAIQPRRNMGCDTLRPSRVRWQGANSIVLRFYIEPISSDLCPSFPELFSTVLLAWETFTQGVFRFVEVKSAHVSDIEVLWTDKTTYGRPYELGHADRRVSSAGWIEHVTITLIKNPVIDGRISENQKHERIKATLLHEWGHALGMEHSQNPQDVMYYQGWRNTKLTHGDWQALRMLYRL